MQRPVAALLGKQGEACACRGPWPLGQAGGGARLRGRLEPGRSRGPEEQVGRRAVEEEQGGRQRLSDRRLLGWRAVSTGSARFREYRRERKIPKVAQPAKFSPLTKTEC